MRELKRQGNAIAMARQATIVATLVTLVTITKESPRATGRGDSGNRYHNKNKDKNNGDLAANQGTRGSIPQEII
jgi:hypothetical protein